MTQAFKLLLFALICICVSVFFCTGQVSHSENNLYIVPLHARHPPVPFREFIKTQNETRAIDYALLSRIKFKEQQHFGSVMTDGNHVDLPDHAIWKNGQVIFK